MKATSEQTIGIIFHNETPRTDKFEKNYPNFANHPALLLAKKLEKELFEAKQWDNIIFSKIKYFVDAGEMLLKPDSKMNPIEFCEHIMEKYKPIVDYYNESNN